MSFPRHHHHEIFTHVMNLVARSVRFEDHDDDALDRMGLPWATNLKSVKALSPKYRNFQRSRKCSACWSFVERFAYRKTKNLSQCVRSNITSGETSCWTWKEIAYQCNATYTIHSIADSCIFAYLVEQFLMILVWLWPLPFLCHWEDVEAWGRACATNRLSGLPISGQWISMENEKYE